MNRKGFKENLFVFLRKDRGKMEWDKKFFKNVGESFRRINKEKKE